jgi:branched-chain amino acid transport system substrate-binding protein
MRNSTSLLCLAAALAVACQKKQEPAPAQPATTTSASTAAGDGPIVVGQVATLTGDQATFGTSTDNGVKLAIEEANAAGGVRGRKLSLKSYDAAGKPEEAATAATRLATEDKVALIIGELASSRSLAIAPIADTNKVPMISPASTSPKVTKDGDKTRPFVFRVCFIDPMQGTVMAKFVRDNLKLTNVAILRDVGSDYSVGLADYFARTFTGQGGQIVADVSFKAGDQDFKAQLTAIRAKNPELLYVPAYYTDVALIGRQVRELGMKMPLAGGDGWDSSKLYEIAQGALDGSYFSNHYTHENPAPVVQEFVQRYKAAYGGTPDAFAALGYDATRVAVDALKRAPDLGGPAVAAALAETKGFPGVTGTITLDADHNPIKSAVILGIQNNAAKYVATVEP